MATASPTGSVVLWNLCRLAGGVSMGASHENGKLAEILKGHKRSVNRVCWHPEDPHLLITGSHDRTVKLWDIRERSKPCANFVNSAEVRDVAFNPGFHTRFLAGLENGRNVVWDSRKPNQAKAQLMGHDGLVLSVTWHPTDFNRFASAGRDGFIYYWNLQESNKPSLSIRNVVAGASVSRLAWRPGYSECLASCAGMGGNDYQLHVWDGDRPALPFRSFHGHTDDVTGLLWLEAGSLVSCSKDGTVRLHRTEASGGGEHPYSKISTVRNTALLLKRFSH